MPNSDDTELDIEGWRESRQLVMSELRRMNRILENLDTKVGGDMRRMDIELATLKTKVALYAAAIAATAAALISGLISYFSKQ